MPPGGGPSAAHERASDLRAFCAANLTLHKAPDSFIPVEALPRTRSGKIQRHLVTAQTLAEEAAG